MSYSAEVFDNSPEQYDGPSISTAMEQAFSVNSASAVALVLVLVVLLVAQLNLGSLRREDAAAEMTARVLGALSTSSLVLSIYGLWLFHLGSMEVGVATLETNHPESWLTVRSALVCSAVAVTLTAMLLVARRGAPLRAVIAHAAPGLALVTAAVISGFLPHFQRQIAAVIVTVLLVILIVSTANLLRAAVAPEKLPVA